MPVRQGSSANKSWPGKDPATGSGTQVLYRDSNGNFHLLVAATSYHTALRRITPEQAKAWLTENGYPIPREIE